MPFIHDDFLLTNQAARHLYHNWAKSEPILDYHCHLPPGDVASNRQFANLFEIWLEGDHYKWRAMRANGVDERYSLATLPRTRNFWLGRGRRRKRCEIRSTTGRIWNCSATSGSTIC